MDQAWTAVLWQWKENPAAAALAAAAVVVVTSPRHPTREKAPIDSARSGAGEGKERRRREFTQRVKLAKRYKTTQKYRYISIVCW
ncbi:hypothetical protein K461DRAFT_283302 [Myriangium duriaei CBS 260.36]|uniref:Uncharacterized protein n=1 Tax=Myriangium duriaei CBS 260.36 TaxID=1168546 RepID=A0A9P4IVW6_9PEZI|nr:hypothetical protein K461DRAFT_283302 [Myriangium duriaei CBS 260.36]